MIGKIAAAMVIGAMSVDARSCPDGSNYLGTLLGCNCKTALAIWNDDANTCICLDRGLVWDANGSSCGLTSAAKTAAVEHIISRYDRADNADSRQKKNLSVLAAWKARKLAEAKFKYENQFRSWYWGLPWRAFYSYKYFDVNPLYAEYKKKYYGTAYDRKYNMNMADRNLWKTLAEKHRHELWQSWAQRAPLEWWGSLKSHWQKWNLDPKYYRTFWGPYKEYLGKVAWINAYTWDEYQADVAGINKHAAARAAFVNDTAAQGKALEEIPDANTVGGIALSIPQRAQTWKGNPYPWRRSPHLGGGRQYHSASPNNQAGFGFATKMSYPYDMNRDFGVFTTQQLNR